MTNSRNVLDRGLMELRHVAQRVDELDKHASNLWRDLQPLICGLRTRRYGKLFQITGGHTHRGKLHVYGAVVFKNGKVGVRGYTLGCLDECEFLPKDQPFDVPIPSIQTRTTST